MKLSIRLLSLIILMGIATQIRTEGESEEQRIKDIDANLSKVCSEIALWDAFGNYRYASSYEEAQLSEFCQFLISMNPKLVSAKNADNTTVLEYVISNHYSQWMVETLIKQGFVYDQNSLKLAIDCHKDASYIKMLLKNTKLDKYVTVTMHTYFEDKHIVEQKTMTALDYYLQERKQQRQAAHSHGMLFALSSIAGDTGQIDQEIVKALTR